MAFLRRRSQPALRIWFEAVLLLLAVAAPAWVNAASKPPGPRLPADPHHIDAHALGSPADLSSTWLVQLGDDPRYAAPGLDDSGWHYAISGQALPGQENFDLPDDVDLVWYRLHVRIPPDARELALAMTNFGGSRQIFVNGVMIGQTGDFKPGGEVFPTDQHVYDIPDSVLALDRGNVTIAIRARVGRSMLSKIAPVGFDHFTTLRLGRSSELTEHASLHAFRVYAPNFTNVVLGALLLLIAIAISVTLPNQLEYPALVVWTAAQVAGQAFALWTYTHSTPQSNALILTSAALWALRWAGMLEFFRLFLKLPRTALYSTYQWVVVCVVFFDRWYWAQSTLGDLPAPLTAAVNFITLAVTLPCTAGIPLLVLYVWWKRRDPDALLLFFPLLISAAYNYTNWAHHLLFLFNVVKSDSLGSPHIAALYFQWWEVVDLAYGVAFLVFLVIRTLRVASARTKVAAEIEAARTMQRVLLARASHPTPGFEVESVYHPAGEVGGDFFLVSPGPENSLTAIVGDVSGKGLVAAMRVSMILGVLKREDSRDPAQVLASLNEALLEQSETGFTTACCVRLDRNGHYAIANAGHIAPYVAGGEIETSPSLPLGLAADQDYELTHGQLKEREKLVLMSDGVVEARSAKGELYGFERLATLTLRPAQEIADTAQSFGQEDDITVLTIACCF